MYILSEFIKTCLNIKKYLTNTPKMDRAKALSKLGNWSERHGVLRGAASIRPQFGMLKDIYWEKDLNLYLDLKAALYFFYELLL